MKRLARLMKEFEKGDCYYAAYATLENLSWDAVNEELKVTDLRLVHGIVIDAEGEYGHGWIEIGDVVIDPASGHKGEKWRFYQQNKVGYTVVYTAQEAYKLVEETKTYGYWDPVIGKVGHLPRPPENVEAGNQPASGESPSV